MLQVGSLIMNYIMSGLIGTWSLLSQTGCSSFA